MKKIYLLLLMLLLLFIPTSVNAVAIYQLDQPIKELDNYTLRQVFTNRNMARPDLNQKPQISAGIYRLYDNGGFTIDYNVLNGNFIYNGSRSSTGTYGIFGFTLPQGLYTLSIQKVSGIQTSGILVDIYLRTATTPLSSLYIIDEVGMVNTITYNTTENTDLFIRFRQGVIYDNYTFKLQLEAGSIATPYQVPTSGPYNQFDFGWLDLTQEQIQTYYNLYLEAVRFEQENVQASQDNGGYQNIFKAIINGVKNLMVEMGYVWSWLNAPLITSDMTSYQFNIDWSWDLIGVVRQILNSAGILTMQILFIVPSLAFSFMGIPVHVSILSLLFSNLIFLLLGWIMVKSFLI